MKNLKRAWALLLAFIVLFTAGCSPDEEKSQDVDGPSSAANSPAEDSTASYNPVAEKVPVVSTPENDVSIGLKNIKIDSSERELTDEQKAVVQYFDNDYLVVPSYEFIRRYPNIFQNAQLTLEGMVFKVLSMDNENYRVVLWINAYPTYDPAYPYGYTAASGEYVILSGKTDPSAWLMENDLLYIDGRYTGIETVDIDGISYTIPTIDVHNAYFPAGRTQFIMAEKFDYKFIKIVAEAIFGKDIEIRDPVAGEDLSMVEAMVENYVLGGANLGPDENWNPSDLLYEDLLVELEDQSNANFKKFRFSKYDGAIVDAKGPFDSGIERRIEFSADFEHFFLFTHNENLESLTLAYYDKSFKKLWEREFEEITDAIYDYTENNLYIVVNNELFIINIQTGEDTFEPSYVGNKKEIRKIQDGIVMVSESKSDGIMKSSLSGDIIWKTNLPVDVKYMDGVQFVDGNIVLSYDDADWTSHYILIDCDSGEILIDAK